MSLSISTARYFLSQNTYCSSVDGHIVFLDLKCDDYLFLEPELANTFYKLMDNSQENDEYLSNTNTADSEKEQQEADQLATTLLEQGLITQNKEAGKTLTPLTAKSPTRDLLGYYKVDSKPAINFGHIVRYFKATIYSAFILRWWPLERVVRRVEHRKKRYQTNRQKNGCMHSEVHGLEHVWDLVEIFRILQPLLFSSKNRCLYNSLALIEFLSCYNIFPNWIFGVRMGPFSAHCWVQQGDILLNDTAANTTSFTPILGI